MQNTATGLAVISTCTCIELAIINVYMYECIVTGYLSDYGVLVSSLTTDELGDKEHVRKQEQVEGNHLQLATGNYHSS